MNNLCYKRVVVFTILLLGIDEWGRMVKIIEQ